MTAAQYAPVAPLTILKQLAYSSPEALGRYHLLLAPDILADPDEHARFWQQLSEPKWIVVDNGVIEEGQSRPLTELAEAARIVGANVVVLPDVVGNVQATIEEAERSIAPLRAMLPEVLLLGVAQGSSPTEFMDCAIRLELLGVDWLGLPKGYQESLGKPRAQFVDRTVSGLPLHLFGFSNDFVDDMVAARTPYGPFGGREPLSGRPLRIWPSPAGIDSAAPIWLGAHGVGFLGLPRTYSGRRPSDYWRWGPLEPEQLNTVIHNILTVRAWLELP